MTKVSLAGQGADPSVSESEVFHPLAGKTKAHVLRLCGTALGMTERMGHGADSINEQPKT